MKRSAGFWFALVLILLPFVTFGVIEVVQRRRYDHMRRRIDEALDDLARNRKLTRTPSGAFRLAGPSDPVQAHFRSALSNKPVEDPGPCWFWIVRVSPEDERETLPDEPILLRSDQRRRLLFLRNELLLRPLENLHPYRSLQPVVEEVLKAHGLDYRIEGFDR